ncbi:MAG: PI-actitoxin-Axm2a [Marteilia pararefringens]
MLLISALLLATHAVMPTVHQKLESEPQTIDCNLPLEAGPCKARFPRFYYNTDEGKCMGFVYGGCRGNSNNFEEKDDCESACIPNNHRNLQ